MFKDELGLLNSRKDETNAENALLFTVEHWMLTRSMESQNALISALRLYEKSPGLIEQSLNKTLASAEKHMSHDNLTAVVAFSKMLQLKYHVEIWEEIKRQWLRYDIVSPPTTLWQKLVNKRFIHPRDLIYYGYAAGNWICIALLPILWIVMLLSTLTKYKVRPNGKFIHTDGKLLNFVRICPYKNRIMWKWQWTLHTFIIRHRFGSWNGVFGIYFADHSHPNYIASKDI